MIIPVGLKQLVSLVPGAVWARRRLLASGFAPRERVPLDRPSLRRRPPAPDPAQLRSAYLAGPVSAMPDTFVLYRIIGNDLPPRHARGQCRENLAFILAHEPELPGCEKRFVVNRIVDAEEDRAVIALLEKAGMRYIHIPFDEATYRGMPWDIEGVPARYAPWSNRFSRLSESEQGRILMRLYRHKNNYVMNNNGARNAALREGRAIAKWVLPWDGNCFVTASAWSEIRAAVLAMPEQPYFTVPMARITDNTMLFDPDHRPRAAEEPQILFRCDASEEFDTDYPYGRRPKVELLWRLGVPGPWDDWAIEPWDLPCPSYAADAGVCAGAGWVARLFSGRTTLEEDRGKAGATDRGLARVEAICTLLDRLDDMRPVPDRMHTRFVRAPDDGAGRIDDALRAQLREAADAAMTRGPWSVMDKHTLPPSGNRHDYWHPAPYYWPALIPGMPYVRRDGCRVPGTELYDERSNDYDRTRLQRLFDDTFVLALGWKHLGDEHYAGHAATLIRTWFLEPDTRMNPHLEYAQVRWGHKGNKGACSGIIEMKDLYYFLDGVRFVAASGKLSRAEQDGLMDWLGQYLHWLRSSPQGVEERATFNNHGTCYDLQVASIAAFLGDTRCVRETLRDSRSRILQQFDAEGRQPEEMKRSNTAHYCCFNLQAWVHMAGLAETCGEDLWSFEGRDGRGIKRAMHGLLSRMNGNWPHPQAGVFEKERFYPLYHAYRRQYSRVEGERFGDVPPMNMIKALFHPHDGIMPFWQLG